MMANTTLQCEFESVSGEDHAQVMRRWVVAETNVEAIDVKVDVVLAGADDKESWGMVGRYKAHSCMIRFGESK